METRSCSKDLLIGNDSQICIAIGCLTTSTAHWCVTNTDTSSQVEVKMDLDPYSGFLMNGSTVWGRKRSSKNPSSPFSLSPDEISSKFTSNQTVACYHIDIPMQLLFLPTRISNMLRAPSDTLICSLFCCALQHVDEQVKFFWSLSQTLTFWEWQQLKPSSICSDIDMIYVSEFVFGFGFVFGLCLCLYSWTLLLMISSEGDGDGNMSVFRREYQYQYRYRWLIPWFACFDSVHFQLRSVSLFRCFAVLLFWCWFRIRIEAPSSHRPRYRHGHASIASIALISIPFHSIASHCNPSSVTTSTSTSIPILCASPNRKWKENKE